MSIIGSIVGSAASIYGGISAASQARKMMREIQEQRKRNQDWYDRRYNEDATQRADAQALLNRTEESIRNRNRAAQGTAAVMGGTDESVAAAKAANNEALADAASRVTANNEARKDQIEQQYRQKDDAYAGQLNGLRAQTANNIAQAVQGVGGMVNGLFDSPAGEDGKDDENAKKAVSGGAV